MKVIIVGGVAGGASTAARLRRLDEHAEITLYERTGFISYANCGLPYYIGGVITDKEALTLQTPESFLTRFNITAKVKHEVIDIDPSAKTVTVKNLETGEEFQDTYDKLVLSPGGKPIQTSVPDTAHDRVFVLRTVEDTFRIHEYVQTGTVKSVLVVGGGFIGLEAAENLKHLGLEVTLAGSAPQVLPVLDGDMASQLHATLRKNGVHLLLEHRIACVKEEKGLLHGEFTNGGKIAADMIVLAIGVTPDTALAEKAGLEMGQKGSIVVNEKMETSVHDIYAVGDAVEVTNFVTGSKAVIPLAGPANKQGRIVADNIVGKDSRFNGTQGSIILKLFDMTAAATGINEKQATAAGIAYDKVILSPSSHAGYYPGGKVMTMKVLFNKESRKLLGAQIVGFEGVDKRIDVLATALRAGMKAEELAELELAYAPPYSSAKDPVNMAGFVIGNIIDGTVRQFYYEDVSALPRDGSVFLLDVRTPSEYAKSCADGFINIPVDELRDRLSEVPKDKPVYVMCQSGVRSYLACRILSGEGYTCYNFAGGYRFYLMVEKDRLANAESLSCGADK